jgi:hypothetical protein
LQSIVVHFGSKKNGLNQTLKHYLHNYLEAHLDGNLKAIIKHNDACKDKVLKTWVAAVWVLDEVQTSENKGQCDLIEEALQHQVTESSAL